MVARGAATALCCDTDVALDPHPHHPTRDPRVLDEVLADGSIILFHTATRALMTLNRTAALVWELCDGERDEAALVAEVQDVFPDALDVDADVRTILSDLRSREMLRAASTAQS